MRCMVRLGGSEVVEKTVPTEQGRVSILKQVFEKKKVERKENEGKVEREVKKIEKKFYDKIVEIETNVDIIDNKCDQRVQDLGGKLQDTKSDRKPSARFKSVKKNEGGIKKSTKFVLEGEGKGEIAKFFNKIEGLAEKDSNLGLRGHFDLERKNS